MIDQGRGTFAELSTNTPMLDAKNAHRKILSQLMRRVPGRGVLELSWLAMRIPFLPSDTGKVETTRTTFGFSLLPVWKGAI